MLRYIDGGFMGRWVLTLDVRMHGGEEEHYKRVFKCEPDKALVYNTIVNLGYDEFVDGLGRELGGGIKESNGIRFELYEEKLKQNKVR